MVTFALQWHRNNPVGGARCVEDDAALQDEAIPGGVYLYAGMGVSVYQERGILRCHALFLHGMEEPGMGKDEIHEEGCGHHGLGQ